MAATAGPVVAIDGELVATADAAVSAVRPRPDRRRRRVRDDAGRPAATAFAARRHLAAAAPLAGRPGHRRWPSTTTRCATAMADRRSPPTASTAGRLRLTVTGGVEPARIGPRRGRADRGDRHRRPAAPGSRPPTVVTVPWPRNERSAVAGLKTTSYAENVVALERAHGQGASEAIFANTAGPAVRGHRQQHLRRVERSAAARRRCRRGAWPGSPASWCCELVDGRPRSTSPIDRPGRRWTRPS